MTRPKGKLLVEVLGDVSKLADQIKRDADRALRGIDLDTTSIERDLDDIAEAGGEAFRELGRTADRILDDIATEGDRASTEVGDDFEAGGERAEAAIGEVGDRGEREMDRIEREAKDAGGSLVRTMRTAAIGIGAAFAAIGIARYFASATAAAEDLGSAIENTEQLIKTTGGTAKLTADEVRELSRSLSLKIGVDSAEVQTAANILLTFKKVSGSTFREAIGLAADATEVLKTDLNGAVLQLGKALNDPVRGVTALSRAGIQFDDVQRAQIKGFIENNQLAKAQAVILGEVRGQVEGVAEAGADITDLLAVAFLDLKREAGGALIEFLDSNGPALIALIQKMEPVVSKIGALLADAFEAALPFLDILITAIRDNFATIGPALAPLADVFATVFDLLPKIVPTLVQVGQAILPALATAAEAIAVAIGPAIGQLAELAAQFLLALLPAVGPLTELVVALLPLVPLAVDLLAVLVPVVAVLASLAAVLAGALAGPLGGLASFLADNVPLVWTLIAAITALAVVSNAMSIALAAATVVGNIWSAAAKVWTGVQWLLNAALTANPIGIVIVAIAALVAGIILAWKHSAAFRTVVIAIGKALLVAGKAIAGAFVVAWHAVVDFFKGAVDFFKNFPSRLVAGIKALPGLLVRALKAAFDAGVKAVGVGIGLLLAGMLVLPHLIVRGLRALPGLLADLFTSLWRKLTAVTVAGVNAVVAHVTSLPGKAWAALSRLPGLLGSALSAAWKAAKSAAAAGLNAVVGLISSAPGRLASLAGRFVSAGKSLIKGFMSGFSAAGQFIKNVAGSIVNSIKGFLNNIIGKLNAGIAAVDDKLPFVSLPRIPTLAQGGLTTTGTLAALHPRELVLPLEDRRAVDLLAQAMREAQRSLRDLGVPGADGMNVTVIVEIDGQQLEGRIVRVVDERDRRLTRRVLAGAGRPR